MTEYCQICGMYENRDNFKLLSCGCTFCKFSVSEWVIAQLENYYKDNFILNCPLGVLGHILTEQDLQSCLKPEQLAQYESTKLKKGLLKDPSYRQCPMNHCSYIGWVEPGLSCSENLICGKCNGSWNDPSLLPGYSRALRTAQMLWSGTNDFWSYIWKEIWVKYCPKCDSPIEKNGGCYHMTCQNCSYEFCWDCLQPYRNHKIPLCQVSVGYTWGLTIFMMIGALVRFSWLSDVFFEILTFLLLKLLVIIVGAFSVLIYFWTVMIFFEMRRATSNPICIKLGFVFMLALSSILLVGAYEFFEYFLEIIEIACSVGVSVAVSASACIVLFKRSG